MHVFPMKSPMKCLMNIHLLPPEIWKETFQNENHHAVITTAALMGVECFLVHVEFASGVLVDTVVKH